MIDRRAARGARDPDLAAVSGGAAVHDGGTVPHTLFDERWRVLRAGIAADRRTRGARFRRRALIPAAVASGVLAGTGLLGAWATSTAPVSSIAPSPVTPEPTQSELAALAQLQRTLHADRAAIAALPKVMPAAGTASSGAGTTTPGTPSVSPSTASATATATAASAPSVPALPPLPSISVAPLAAPPATQGTTGASGIP